MKKSYMEDYIKYICLSKPLRYINNSLKPFKTKKRDKRFFYYNGLLKRTLFPLKEVQLPFTSK